MIKREVTLQCRRRFNVFSILSSDSHHQNLISLLQSCDRISQAAQVHSLMLKAGLDRVPYPLSKLLARVSMLDVDYAASIFKQLRSPNLYMFNTMLRAHSAAADPRNGLLLFNRMRAENHGEDFSLDHFTFISVLKCCSRSSEVRAGIGVHAVVLKSGFDSVLNVANALLHFYCVCGRIGDARQLFDEMSLKKDLVSWNTLMGGYLCLKNYALVLHLFKTLRRESFGVSVTTILSVISAAGQVLNASSLGESIHTFCFKVGFSSKLNVAAALISMYGKLSDEQAARRIFDELDDKSDVVLWNCLIDAYARNALLEEAMELLRLMKNHGVRPNSSTLAGLISSSSEYYGSVVADYVCDYVKEQRLPLDAVLGTAIIDMYAKNGFLEKAVDVFDKLESKDVKTWTAMISGCGVHGAAESAVALLHQMEKECFVPNEVTFLAVLNACSHGGLVTEGLKCFKRMVETYGLKPKIEHYGCIVDLLGRGGLLEEAYEVIRSLPVERDATAWRSLLGACRVFGNVELAERVKEELERICGNHPADSLSVAATYAAAGMVANSRCELESCRKGAGCSKIESPL